tara:strand:- start:920 stop:1030 length:111 start_codon:yes stop_codon:yes gene_type:complete
MFQHYTDKIHHLNYFQIISVEKFKNVSAKLTRIKVQ